MTDNDLILWDENHGANAFDDLMNSMAAIPCRVLQTLGSVARVRARFRFDPASLPNGHDRRAWEQLLWSHLGRAFVQTLYPHQKAAICRFLQLDGCMLLAAEPGTGKTMIVICIFVLLRMLRCRGLIICPGVAIAPWCMELRRCAGFDESSVQLITTTTVPKTKKTSAAAAGAATGTGARMLQGATGASVRKLIDPTKRIIVTTFKIATMLFSELMAEKFDFVALDEAHSIKNEHSERTKAITPLMHQARYRIAMTGTPGDIVTHMYGLLHAVRPDLFPSYHAFCSEWCDAKTVKLPGGVVRTEWVAPKDRTRLDSLNALLYGHVMYRVAKTDVLKDLPPKIIKRKYLDATDDEGKAELRAKLKKLEAEPDAVVSDSEEEEDVPIVPPPGGAPLTGRKRKCSASSSRQKKPAKAPRLDASGNAVPPSKLELYGKILQGTVKLKLPYVLEELQRLLASGLHKTRKILLFANHYKMLNFLGNALDQAKLDYIRIDGKVSSPFVRGALCAKFQGDENCRFAVLSIRACSTAITLTAASTVIFTEFLPTPSDSLQAEDRAHRIGQKFPVNVEYWTLAGSLDETLYRIVENKKEQMSYVLRQT